MTASPDLQAADWFARLQSGDLSIAERSEFERWLDEQPANAVAFARVEFAWERAGRLSELAGETPDGFVARPETTPSRGRFDARKLYGWVAAAVSVVLAIGGAAWFLASSPDVYTTALAERKTIDLEDGSRVSLNTKSRVSVDFDERSRTVRLERGEALFDVAHDADRPFVVQVNGAEVRAIGTAFNVRLRSRMVEVMVTEGEVHLKAEEPRSSAARRESDGSVAPRSGSDQRQRGDRHEMVLPAGRAAVVAAGVVEEVALSEDAIRRRIAWRDGVIELQGETLAQAVEEFNRYSDAGLVIADPSLARLRVGGRFHTDEADRFVNALETHFSIRAVEAEGGEIYLLRAE